MHPRTISIIVALLAMVAPFTIDTYLPSFPSIEAEFQISRAMLTQSLGSYLVGFAIATLFWGPLSDSVGRKRVIIAGMILYALASLGCALADNYTHFLLFRIAQGVAASGGMVIGRAMIRDQFGPQQAQRAMAQVMMLFAIAPAIAPIIGGVLHDLFGWRSVFYFLTAYGVLIFMLVQGFIVETLPEAQRQSLHPLYVATTYGQIVQHGRFILLTLTIATAFGGFFLYIVGAPTVVFDLLHLGDHGIPIMFVPLVIGIIAGSYLASRVANIWSQQRTISLALATLSAATLLNLAQAWLASATPLLTIAPVAIYAFGIALMMPVMTVMSLDCFPHHRGAASAVQGCVQMTINAGIASLVVPLLSATLLYFVLGQTACLLIALLLWYTITRHAPANSEIVVTTQIATKKWL
ncbi:MAG: multidrug effflux MFS transporter [Mariprofundales bacterium]|nr:multidrug effflux MFS transporter [Mariprofundales bacterium]